MKKQSFYPILILLVFLLQNTPVLFAQGGKVFETYTVKSSILNMERNYAIYLPPGYEDTDMSYPVLYLLHEGGDDHTGWVQFGQVQHIADKAIREGIAAPMIIVMPDANTGIRGYFNSVDEEFNYEDFFFTKLIPHIEKTTGYVVNGVTGLLPDFLWVAVGRFFMLCTVRMYLLLPLR